MEILDFEGDLEMEVMDFYESGLNYATYIYFLVTGSPFFLFELGFPLHWWEWIFSKRHSLRSRRFVLATFHPLASVPPAST